MNQTKKIHIRPNIPHLANGTVTLRNYKGFDDQIWIIQSDCDQVQISSTHFDIANGTDSVVIDGMSYNGISPVSQRLLSGSFRISFLTTLNGLVSLAGSASSFSLNWTCLAGNG